MSPVWTYLGLHGLDNSDPEAPKIIHAFMPRGTEGYEIKEVWDTLGMRATQSQDTILDGAFVPDRYIGRVVPAGAAGIDLFTLGIFAWALTTFGNVYYGIAQRVLEMTIEAVKGKSSIALTRSMAHHPEVQHAIAEMVMEMEAIAPQLDKVAEDWSNGVDHGQAWVIKLVGAKYRAVEGVWKVVDAALDVTGGFGIFKKSPIERLWRDARLGKIHPGNYALSHEFVAKVALGIDPDEPPRWG
jgi:alkylation response protein AidB-like acyl-CoA dehydrogenase